MRGNSEVSLLEQHPESKQPPRQRLKLIQVKEALAKGQLTPHLHSVIREQQDTRTTIDLKQE